MKKEEQEKYLQLQMLQQQIEQINQHLELLNQQSLEVDLSIKSIQEIAKTKLNQEILAPLANGIFLKTELKDNQKLIVNVGSNVTVEKTTLQVIELLQQQQVEVNQRLSEAEAILQQLSAQAMKIYQEVQQK